MEKTCSGSKEAPGKIQGLPLNVQYQNHKCSSACLAYRAVGSYKGENPLKIPILFDFQRRHAKADCLSKPLDVNYKAPCGRSLRSFRDVRNYLFETECNFLFVDHFSFNTYVLLGRNTMNPEPLVFEFDISDGAESVPISFCNNLDHARLPYFKYRKSSWPRGYYLNNLSSLFVDSCDCTDGCIDRWVERSHLGPVTHDASIAGWWGVKAQYQTGPALLEYLVPCFVLTDTIVSFSSPELGCSHWSTLCCREGSNQQVDYCVPFPFFQTGSASSPGGIDNQISWLWKKSREGSLVQAETGLFLWQAGKDPA